MNLRELANQIEQFMLDNKIGGLYTVIQGTDKTYYRTYLFDDNVDIHENGISISDSICNAFEAMKKLKKEV